MLLGQQKISARFSNYPLHNHLAVEETTGVRSVCNGVLLRSDGHAASKWTSLYAVETAMLPSFAMQSPISKKHWYESSLLPPELQFRRQIIPSKNPDRARILSQSTDGRGVTMLCSGETKRYE